MGVSEFRHAQLQGCNLSYFRLAMFSYGLLTLEGGYNVKQCFSLFLFCLIAVVSDNVLCTLGYWHATVQKRELWPTSVKDRLTVPNNLG